MKIIGPSSADSREMKRKGAEEKMNNKSFLPVLAMGIVLLLSAGCKSGDEGATASATTGTTPVVKTEGTGDAAKPIDVAFVTNNTSDFWKIARKGTEKAQSEVPGVTVEFKLPPEGTAAEQKQIINDLLAKGVQGIAISPKDPPNQTALLNDVAKKALVITQDSDAPASDRACYIGTDNLAAGKQLGEEVMKALPAGGKIMVFVGAKDVQNAKDRLQGLQDAIKGSKVTILDVRTDNADRGKAKQNVSDAIVANQDLAGCVGLWSYNGPAILNAVKAANKSGKIKIVCFDEEDDTLQGIKDGAIDATVVQQPFTFGEESIKLMAKVLRGDKSAIPASKQILIPTQVITKANVEEFQANLKKQTGG